jgi:mannose-6-phosphate isomerase-like protein (cupin superfamily)
MSQAESATKRRIRFEDAAARLADHDEPSVDVFRHGTLQVELYAPRERDKQIPHARDEVYVVVRGTGTYVHGDQRVPCAPHDLLFAPAGLEHRFEGFSEDFAVWVLFYGPEGGEVDEDRRRGTDRRVAPPPLEHGEDHGDEATGAAAGDTATDRADAVREFEDPDDEDR